MKPTADMLHILQEISSMHPYEEHSIHHDHETVKQAVRRIIIEQLGVRVMCKLILLSKYSLGANLIPGESIPGRNTSPPTTSAESA